MHLLDLNSLETLTKSSIVRNSNGDTAAASDTVIQWSLWATFREPPPGWLCDDEVFKDVLAERFETEAYINNSSITSVVSGSGSISCVVAYCIHVGSLSMNPVAASHPFRWNTWSFWQKGTRIIHQRKATLVVVPSMWLRGLAGCRHLWLMQHP